MPGSRASRSRASSSRSSKSTPAAGALGRRVGVGVAPQQLVDERERGDGEAIGQRSGVGVAGRAVGVGGGRLQRVRVAPDLRALRMDGRAGVERGAAGRERLARRVDRRAGARAGELGREGRARARPARRARRRRRPRAPAAASAASARASAARRGRRRPSAAGDRPCSRPRGRARRRAARPGSRPARPRRPRAGPRARRRGRAPRSRGPGPAATACARRIRAQKPWKVVIQAASASRAASRWPSSSRRARTRARSSPAAFSVKVMASTWSARRPSCTTEATKRSTSTDVLPEPALADEHEVALAARRSASRCSGVNGARHAEAASQRQIVGCAQPPRYAHAVGSGTSAPDADAAHRLERRVEHLLQERLEPARARRRSFVTLAGRGRRRRASSAARAPVVVAAERLVEAADGLEAEQLRQREQVERRPAGCASSIQLACGGGALALVVVDDRLAAVGADVDAVDAARQAQLAAGQLGRPQRVLRRRRSAARTRAARRPSGRVRGVLDVAQQVGLQAPQGRARGARGWARSARRRRARRARRAAARGPRRGARA